MHNTTSLIKIAIVSLLMSVTVPCIWAQEGELDSLKIILQNAELSQKERIETLQTISSILVNVRPAEALEHAREAFELSVAIDDVEIHARSYRRLGYALYNNRLLDEFRDIQYSYITYCEKHKMYDQVAAAYRNLSKIGESRKEPDSSLYYLQKCLDVLAIHPDSIILMDSYLSQGLVYTWKGYYVLAIEAFFNGLRTAEALKVYDKIPYFHMNMAITYAYMKQSDESAKQTETALQLFKERGNHRQVTRCLTNLGIQYAALNRDEEALTVFSESIETSEETNLLNVGMFAHIGKARIFIKKEDYTSALKALKRAENLALQLDEKFSLGTIARLKTIIAIGQSNLSDINKFTRQAEGFLDNYREPIEEAEVYFEMAELYERQNLPIKALSFTKLGFELQDSLFTRDRDNKFAELNIIYETERKDAQILLLKEQKKLDTLRKRNLIYLVILLLLASLFVIVILIDKKRRAALIAQTEKNLEIERRKSAEQELEFKQKELAARVLQLAGKNEFLQTLESEVEQLKSSVDLSVRKISNRIVHLIQFDNENDEEWDHFSHEFSSIHDDFLARLVDKHGEFSKNEFRLIALLKMNLSSKDISNILRITLDGVKKARYRLRKKMSLESSVDIQDYLLQL